MFFGYQKHFVTVGGFKTFHFYVEKLVRGLEFLAWGVLNFWPSSGRCVKFLASTRGGLLNFLSRPRKFSAPDVNSGTRSLLIIYYDHNYIGNQSNCSHVCMNTFKFLTSIHIGHNLKISLILNEFNKV